MSSRSGFIVRFVIIDDDGDDDNDDDDDDDDDDDGDSDDDDDDDDDDDEDDYVDDDDDHWVLILDSSWKALSWNHLCLNLNSDKTEAVWFSSGSKRNLIPTTQVQLRGTAVDPS